MYKLYSMQRSGNSYKVRLALALLNAPYQAIEVDILRGESRTPDFLAKNPSGQVPLLEVADGRYLAESNAILWYVAGGTSLAPESRIERAEALQWMFFEQHALEPNIGAAYFWLSLVKGGRDLQTHALEDWMERGYGALQVMEDHHLKRAVAAFHPVFQRVSLQIAPAFDQRQPEISRADVRLQRMLFEEHPLQRFRTLDPRFGRQRGAAGDVPQDGIRFGKIASVRDFQQRHLSA